MTNDTRRANGWDAGRIRELRTRGHFTHAEFAARLGVSLRTVFRWQSGDEEPSPLAREKLEDLAHEVPV